jgi:serine protease AprX
MRASRLLSILALLAASLATTTALRGAPQAASEPQLRLHRTTIDTSHVSRNVSTALNAAAAGPYTIIQFRGPVLASDRAALEQTGVELLEYLPDYAYLVRGGERQLAAAAHVPHIYARLPFTNADKLAPALLRALARGDALAGVLRVIGWPGDKGELERDLRGATVNLAATASAATLLQIAALPSVRWIEPAGRPRILNDVARTIMHVDPVWQSRHLFGAGQRVAVVDSGLDTGDLATISPDFAGRIVATQVLSPGGDLADTNGHGTHVAGSVAGAGVQSGANPAQHQYAGSFAGVAPEAQLVIQAFEALADGTTVGIPADYYPLFNQAYTFGARLDTNSWGDLTGPISDTAAAFGGYPYGSQRTDQFIWDHPDMSVFFAAGNSGSDGTPSIIGFCTGGDGVIDSDSLLAPGTAKNVITVGASENLRTSGGLSGLPWLFLSCAGSDPIATDTPSNNANGMAAFSSRGPADDGRVKPDIVAPGTNIVSNHSHAPNAGTLWGAHETNPNYVYSGGTSMSTPLAAGMGTLVRQWLTTRGLANPSAAAVKATLLDTTADMAPGQYGTGPTQEIPSIRPNSVDGWGRADLAFMNAPAPYALWVDDHTAGLATNDVVDYADTFVRPLEVLDSSQPLRVMLAWTDPAASLSASSQLVNDLDLVVTGPGGTYYGNNVASGDRINNVEGVIVNSPPVGQYTVQVRAHNVAMAAQPYALVVGGPLANVGQLSLSKTANPATRVAPGGLLTYTLTLGAGSRAITQSIVLSDTLPANTTFVSASDGGTQTGGVVQWDVPSLAANTTITRTLVVQVDGGVTENTPIVNADYRAENGVDLPGVGTPVTVVAGTQPSGGSLTLGKTADPSSSVAPGGLITYTLTLGAVGAPMSGVVVADTLPAHTAFVSASGTFTQGGPGNSVITWSLGTVGDGQSVAQTLTVRVLPDTLAGTVIRNSDYAATSASANAGGPPVDVIVGTHANELYLPLVRR